LSQSIVDAAYADDPASASSEYGGCFRSDIDAFVTREAMEAVTVFGRYELAPEPRQPYCAFADVSGGGGGDSFTVAVAYRRGDVGVLAALREWKPPFSPTDVIEECAALLRSYGIIKLICDKWGSLFVVESFSKHGVTCGAECQAQERYLPGISEYCEQWPV
jgi:hypothetical protein